MVAKKKDDKKKAVNNPKGKGKTPPNPEKQTTLGDIIKNAEQAIVVTVSKGNIEVTAIKAVNYSYEAKSLLMGAMDNYHDKPIIHGLNSNTRVLMAQITNFNNKITNLVLDELPENAKKYVKRIEELMEVPISIVSLGPERNQTLILKKEFLF